MDGKGAFLLRERRSERALGPHRPRYVQKQCREAKDFNIKRKQFKALGESMVGYFLSHLRVGYPFRSITQKFRKENKR